MVKKENLSVVKGFLPSHATAYVTCHEIGPFLYKKIVNESESKVELISYIHDVK